MHAQSADLGQVVERDVMRVPVVVAGPGRDECHTRAGRAQQRWTAARIRPVVADLQHVDGSQQPPPGQHRLDWCLRVTGEQGTEAAAAQQGHDRRVIDVGVGERPGDIVGGRVEEREPGQRVESNALPGARRHEPAACLCARQLPEARVGRVRVVASGVEDQSHLIALERCQQAGHVILVRVREDHRVDLPPPPRKTFAEASEQEVGIRPPVDERRGAGGRDDQDRIALPDVQHDEVGPAVRQGCEREAAEQEPQAGEPGRRSRERGED